MVTRESLTFSKLSELFQAAWEARFEKVSVPRNDEGILSGVMMTGKFRLGWLFPGPGGLASGGYALGYWP
jgi:hypothetical protein